MEEDEATHKKHWEAAVSAVRAFSRGQELTDTHKEGLKCVVRTDASAFISIFPEQSREMVKAGVIDGNMSV